MRKICVITGSRSDYGLLRWVMDGINSDSELVLQVIATGMHLSPEFGMTYEAIERDGFHIDLKVEMLTSSDSSVGIAKSIGLGLIGFADSLNSLNPDLVVVLGDRFEIFAAVSAAFVARIPVAHIHGGESTEGAFDEGFRHSITKMSSMHFVAAPAYQDRVIQLGENPDRVFMVGGLGIDGIKNLPLLGRSDLESSLKIQFGIRNLLITFHPATLDIDDASSQLNELLLALSDLVDTTLIFTLPNADTESRKLVRMINEFASRTPNSYVFSSLGQIKYLSCIAQVDGVVGNSSSGLIEAPSFRKGTINIGSRQRGRLRARSVIDCDPNKESITRALSKLYSDCFKKGLNHVENPYGEGGASLKILNVLKNYPLENILEKKFFNIPISFEG